MAAAASGKAGGFLALDWCAGSPLDGLARRSFGLHAALPGEIAGDWGYRRMTAYAGIVVPDRDHRRHVPANLPWLSDGVIIDSRLGTTKTTGIVHRAPGRTVSGVEFDGGDNDADAIVPAMGRWSLTAGVGCPPCTVSGASAFYDTGTDARPTHSFSNITRKAARSGQVFPGANGNTIATRSNLATVRSRDRRA